MTMNKKVLYLAILPLLLIACDTSGSASNSTSVSSVSLTPISWNFGSNSASNKPSTSTSQGTSNTSNSTSNANSVSEADFNKKLIQATLIDKLDINEVSVYTYLSDAVDKSTTRQDYSIKQYSNNITIQTGKVTKELKDGTRYIETYTTQNTYDASTTYLTSIKKYSGTFNNSISMTKYDETSAKYLLEIGPATRAYFTINSLVSKFGGIDNFLFECEKDSSGGLDATYFYCNPLDGNENLGTVMAAGIQVKIDKEGYVYDFFYGYGYYHQMDATSATRMRRSGPYGFGQDGYSCIYESITKGERKEYEGDLPFPLEDNIPSSISFESDTINISLSDIVEDEKGLRYINLLDYLATTPKLGETTDAPANVATFSLKDNKVGHMDDSKHYLIFNGPTGEIEVTVNYKLGNLDLSASAKIVVTE